MDTTPPEIKKETNSPRVRVGCSLKKKTKYKKSAGAKGQKHKKNNIKKEKSKMKESNPDLIRSQRKRMFLRRKLVRLRQKVMHLCQEPGAPLLALIRVSGTSIEINGSDTLCKMIADNAHILTNLRLPEVPEDVNTPVIDLKNIDIKLDYGSINILVCRKAYSRINEIGPGKRQLYKESDKPCFWPQDVPFVSHAVKGPDGKGRLLTTYQIRDVVLAFQKHCLWRIRMGDKPVNYVHTTNPEELKQYALACYPSNDPKDWEPPLTAVKVPKFEVKLQDNFDPYTYGEEPMDIEEQKKGVVDLKNIDLSLDFNNLNILHCRRDYSKIIQRDGCIKQKWNPRVRPTYWPQDIPFVSHSAKAPDGKGRILTSQMVRRVLCAFKDHSLKKIREGYKPINHVATTDPEQLSLLATSVQSENVDENVEPQHKMMKIEFQGIDSEIESALAQLIAAGGYQVIS